MSEKNIPLVKHVIPVVQLLDRWKDSTVVEWPIRYHSITGGEDA